MDHEASAMGAAMTSNMHWTPVGKYGKRCGLYTVGKFFLDGSTLYLLSYGDEKIKYCEDFDECKEAADAHRTQRTAK